MDDDDDSEEDARPRQRQHIEASSDVEQDEEMSDEDVDMNGAFSSADDQMAKKLVRYAISCEYSRTAIRRDGIKERGRRTEERRREEADQLITPWDSTRKTRPFV